MEQGPESQDGEKTARDRLESALTLVNEYCDNLIENAPVMLHSIDQYLKLVGVNNKWLATLRSSAAVASNTGARSSGLPRLWNRWKCRLADERAMVLLT